MIVYLLVIIFFIFLSNNESFDSFDSFVDYREVYSKNKEHKIYKSMYKCKDYEDIRIN